MSIWPISIRYEGKPQGKERSRVKTVKGKTWGYTPTKTVSYEDDLKWLAKSAMSGLKPSPASIYMRIEAYFKPKPKEHGVHYTRKPDADNIAKSVADALNGIVYMDDEQIAELTIVKLFGPSEYLLIEVGETELD